jgi:NADH-quinone oxidoreductase subunit J
MNAQSIIFYAIAAFILGTAIMAVTTRMIFRAAIWLLSSLIGIAALYFWMQLEFIAAVQIIVYVGGIVVLIIFSIFLTQQSGNKMPSPLMKQTVFSVLASLFGIGFTYNIISHHSFSPISSQPFVLNVNEVGRQMLSPTEHGFILPFEVVSMLLLASMVGCIVIAMKSSEDKKIPVSTNGNGNGKEEIKGELIVKKINTNESTVEEVI